MPTEHEKQRRREPDPIGERCHGKHRGNQAEDGESDCHVAMFPSGSDEQFRSV
jgi:hypothetical protein